MSVQPAIFVGNSASPYGLAQSLADIRRQIQQLQAQRTIIGSDAITGAQIASGTISTSEIAAGSITAGLIAALAINAGHIQANAITSAHIAANQITATHIAAGAIQAGDIQAGAIVAGDISSGAITTDKLAANAITSDKIAANQITATQIAAGAVTATKINVTTLSSLTTDMGALTAGTITGATVQTAASGSRVVINSAGLSGYASDGTTKTFEINTGTGQASFTGTATLNAASIIPGGALSALTISGGNLIPNSSFEQGLDTAGVDRWQEGFSATTSTASKYTTEAFQGSTSVRLVATAATSPFYFGRSLSTQYIPVRAGLPYTFSAWAKQDVASNANSVRCYVEWYNQAGTVITTPSLDGVSRTFHLGVNVGGVPTHNGSVAVNTTSWSRPVLTMTAPAGAVNVRFVVQAFASASNGAIGDSILVDAFMLEQADVPSSYVPKADEVLYQQINAVNLAAGAVTANAIAAGTITTQKLSFLSTSRNLAYDAGFEFATSSSSSAWGGSTNGSYTTATTNPKSGSQVGVLNIAATTGPDALIRVKNRVPQASSEPGKTYSASVWVRQVTATAGRRARLGMLAYDVNGNVMGAAPTNNMGAWIDLPNDNTTWTKLSVGPSAMPVSSTGVGFNINYAVTAGTNHTFTGPGLHLDEAMIVAGEDLPTTFEYRAGDLQPGSVGNTQITADAITTDKIFAGSVTSAKIYSGAVEADRIQAGNIAAGAITAGKIAATAIDAMTVTGATIQSALPTVPNRTVLNSAGMKVWSFLTPPTLSGSVGQVTGGGTAVTAEYWWVRVVLVDAAGVETPSVLIPGTEVFVNDTTTEGIYADVKIDTRAAGYKFYVVRRTGSAGSAPALSAYTARTLLQPFDTANKWMGAGVYRVSASISDMNAGQTGVTPPADVGGTNNTSAESIQFTGSTSTIRGAVYETSSVGPRTTLSLDGLKTIDRDGDPIAHITADSATSAIDLQADAFSVGGRPAPGAVFAPNQYAIRWREQNWGTSAVGTIMAWEETTIVGSNAGSSSNIAMYATDGSTAQAYLELAAKVPNSGTNRSGSLRATILADGTGAGFGVSKNLLSYTEAGAALSDWQFSDDSSVIRHYGSYATAGPPNSTSGDMIVVDGGWYMVTISGSQFSAFTGLSDIVCSVDGSSLVYTKMYINTTGIHLAYPAASEKTYLTPGIHYVWVHGTASNDSNDSYYVSVVPC